MPVREINLLRQAIVDLLQSGERPAWEIEDELARQFRVTNEERVILQASGCPMWRNDVAWALKRLVEQGKIACNAKRKAPDGGTRGRLNQLTKFA